MLLNAKPSVAAAQRRGAPSCVRPVARRSVKASVATPSAATAPPSSATASSELQSLGRLSTIVPDTLALESLTPGAKLAAATVSLSTLRSILLAGSSMGLKPYENAINAALAAGAASSSSPLAAARPLDRALVNVGAMMVDAVWGRVETQVDVNLAEDQAAMLSKVRSLAALYGALRVPRDRLVFGLPATWAGTQAAKQLEAEGIATSLYMVFSEVQGVAAMQAGASVLRINVGRIREWHDKNPGVMMNQFGPREAGLARADPGLALVQQLYCYGRRFHPRTAIMAMGLRTRQDALALAGADYLVLPGRVMAELAAAASDQGYNDGLSAYSGGAGVEAKLTPALAAAAGLTQSEPVTESAWREGLGPVAADLLAAMIKLRASDVAELERLLAVRTSASD